MDECYSVFNDCGEAWIFTRERLIERLVERITTKITLVRSNDGFDKFEEVEIMEYESLYEFACAIVNYLDDPTIYMVGVRGYCIQRC